MNEFIFCGFDKLVAYVSMMVSLLSYIFYTIMYDDEHEEHSICNFDYRVFDNMHIK